MKTSEIRNAYKALKAVSVKKLPVKITIAVAFNLKKLETVVSEISDAERDIVMKYLELGEDGNPIVVDGRANIKKDCIDEYWEAEKAISEKEYAISFDTITLKDIESAFEDRYDGLTADEVLGLSFMTA